MTKKYKTQSLFWEYRLRRGEEEGSTKFTLKEHDHHGFPSLYRLYMEMEDVTEYDFATTYFDSYSHWLHLCTIPWFKPKVESWRHELQQKLKARSLRAIKAVAEADDKDSYAANKYLLTQLDPPNPPKRQVGRPSKEAIAKEAQALVDLGQEFKDDMERMKEYTNGS
jgi:hypothetical protein